ncbi:hypothetical protein Gogos_020381, partial [Gossypium gossypioides]|nr:hypothetical protein [Gossypium gossypioides]
MCSAPFQLAVFDAENRKEKAENFKLRCELRQRTKELEDYKSRNDNSMERRSLLNEIEAIAALKEQLEETSEALKDMESRYSCL